MLHWRVRLFRPGATPAIESTTENLSSEGFYCLSTHAVRLGERLYCDIVIPATSFEYPQPFVILRCAVTVRQIRQLQNGFGLGCHIDDYACLADALSKQTTHLHKED
jgi:hypothetical protein